MYRPMLSVGLYRLLYSSQPLGIGVAYVNVIRTASVSDRKRLTIVINISLPVIGTGSILTRKSVLKLKLASDETDTGVLRAPGDRGTPSPACRASAAAAAAAVPPPPTGSKHNPKKLSPSSMVIADVASEKADQSTQSLVSRSP